MSKCFICLKQVPVPPPPTIRSRSGRGRGRGQKSIECPSKKSTLSDQLTSLFLVHKLLEIPLRDCRELLKEFGNPNDWIDLCSSCLPLVEWAKAVNDKIIAAQKELDDLKTRILAPLEVEVKVEVEGDEDDDVFNGLLEASAVTIRNKFYARRTRARNSTHDDDGPVDPERDPFVDVDEFDLSDVIQHSQAVSNGEIAVDNLEDHDDDDDFDSDNDNYDPNYDDSGEDSDVSKAAPERSVKRRDAHEFSALRTSLAKSVSVKEQKESKDDKKDCPICGRPSKNPRSWRYHIRMKHPPYLLHVDDKIPKGHVCIEGQCLPLKTRPLEEETFRNECPVCGNIYPYKKGLRDHIRIKHPAYLVHLDNKVPDDHVCVEGQCLPCKLTTPRKEMSKSIEKKNERTECPICTGVYKNKKNCRDHIRVKHRPYLLHLDDNIPDDHVCVEGMCLPYNLEALPLPPQLEETLELQNWTCPICSYVYRNKRVWTDHIRKRHNSYYRYHLRKANGTPEPERKDHTCVEGVCPPYPLTDRRRQILLRIKMLERQTQKACLQFMGQNVKEEIMSGDEFENEENENSISVNNNYKDKDVEKLSGGVADKSDSDWDPGDGEEIGPALNEATDIAWTIKTRNTCRRPKADLPQPIKPRSQPISSKVNATKLLGDKSPNSKIAKRLLTLATISSRTPKVSSATETKFKCLTCGMSFKMYNSCPRHIRQAHNQSVGYKDFKLENYFRIIGEWPIKQREIVQKSRRKGVSINNDKESNNKNKQECDVCHRYVRDLVHHNRIYHGLLPFGWKIDLKDWKTVVKEREIAVKALPKPSPNSSKEDRIKYRTQRDHLHLSKLARKYRISKFPCMECDVVLDSFDKWKAHSGENGVHVKGFKCEKCGKIVSHIITLENHHRSFHCPNLNLRCASCQKVFFKSNQYNEHAQKNEECRRRSLRCKHCPTVMYLGNKECLDFHNQIRHLKKPPTPYKCSFCDRRYNTRKGQSKHELVHTDPSKSFICDKCGLAFMYMSRLQQHIKAVHLSKEPGYKKKVCKICNAEFALVSGLSRHLHLHKKESPYVCTVCGKSFKVRNYLTIHMWSHDPKRKNNYGKTKPINKRGPRKRVEPISSSDSEDDYTGQQSNLKSTPSIQNGGNEGQTSSDSANTQGCNPSSSNSVVPEQTLEQDHDLPGFNMPSFQYF